MNRVSHVANPGFDVREYQAGDYYLFERRALDKELDMTDLPQTFIDVSHKATFIVDGEPAGILGLYKIYPGVYHAWSLPSDKLRGYGRQVIRATRSFIDSYMELLEARQFRTSTQEDAWENRKWLRIIGFEEECVQHGILPGGRNLIHFVKWSKLGKEIYNKCHHRN